MRKSKFESAPQFHAYSRTDWRQWLAGRHDKEEGAWLISYKKGTGKPGLTYAEAVEEALCFGWIDSIPSKLDEERWKLWFAPRRPKSAWSKVNKERVERLIGGGLMTPAGLAKIEVAKANGAWAALDEVEALKMPEDLQQALAANATAQTYFEAFPTSVKKGIYDRIRTAKKLDTRARRIAAVVAMAAENRRAGFERK